MSKVLLSFCLLFQTLPDAGTAHFLWRGCHGSALCHSRLLMAETPFLPYQKLKLNSGATSCSPHIFYPSYMFIETFVWCLKKRLTEHWHLMDGRLSTEQMMWTLQNVPNLDRLEFCYQVVFCWTDNHDVLHMYLYTGTPDVPGQNKYYRPCTRTSLFIVYSELHCLNLLCVVTAAHLLFLM